ncbi:3'-5' exonuclease [Olsenella sp. Marseille-P4559]|uniref:3'-5' exonuclease n=1 Tax=Olsenella sp. Marseille-P4559 TaxID=2364795 RepID=UPI0010300D06|nr:3'-5' exonuclease [Olsenella sp. Marseille-P4559]
MTRKETLQKLDPKNVIVFDTETTGTNVGGNDEVLSLAVMNIAGDVLFYDTFKPTHRKRWSKAEAINGISPDMVKDKQTIEERKGEIEPIFKSARLYVAYNADFDLGFLRAAGLDVPEHQTFDVMKEFAKIHGEWNPQFEEWQWCKLEDCAAYYDYRDFGAHDALADVKATSHCYKSILDDFLFEEPRRRPKMVEDEFGDTYPEYDDEEYRTIVSSGYAEETAENASSTDTNTQYESVTPKPETHQEASKQLGKAKPALVVVCVLCVIVGLLITFSGAPVVGILLLAFGVILALVAKGNK